MKLIIPALCLLGASLVSFYFAFEQKDMMFSSTTSLLNAQDSLKKQIYPSLDTPPELFSVTSTPRFEPALANADKAPIYSLRHINFTFDGFGGRDITEWTDEQIQGYIFGALFVSFSTSEEPCIRNIDMMWCSPSDIPVAGNCDREKGICEFLVEDTQELSTASWYDYSLPEYPFYSRDYDTCASRDYPRGTHLKVTAGNGKTVTCRVNDYIEHPDRQIDLSSHAFLALAPLSQGLVQVTIEEV